MRSMLAAVGLLAAASTALGQAVYPSEPDSRCAQVFDASVELSGGYLVVAVEPRAPRVSEWSATLSCRATGVRLQAPTPKKYWEYMVWRANGGAEQVYPPASSQPVGASWTTATGARFTGQGLVAHFKPSDLPREGKLWLVVSTPRGDVVARTLSPKDRQRQRKR